MKPKAPLTVDRISIEQARTLSGLFRLRVGRSPSAVAYEQYDAEKAAWTRYTWENVAERAGRWQTAFDREGLSPRDRVAILLRNCVEWVCFDQAALASGLVVVPLYATDTAENQTYLLADSEARLLLVETAEEWLALASHRDRFPDLQRVLSVRAAATGELLGDTARELDPWLGSSGAAVEDRVEDPQTLATCIYTSGTTGPPKGVMLSHANILFSANSVLDIVPDFPDDVFLSFLPLAHSFERTVGYYLPIIAGSRIVYARSIDSLPSDLLYARPTVLLAISRIYERLYLAVRDKTEGNLVTKAVLARTVATGWRRFEAAQGRAPAPCILERAAWPLLDRFVARKMRSRLGGRVRVAASGGGPLSTEVARFLVSLGMPLLEGYGLTESSAPVCGNRLGDNVPGTVGKALPGVELKLGPKNELLVRSPGVMLGYWNRPEATREAIDADGWLHTGDCAEIREGRVSIVGRLKEILVTSTGENVPPANVEGALEIDPLIDQALVVGDGMPYLAALLVLNPQGWRELAISLGVCPEVPESLRQDAVTAAVLERVRGLLKSFPTYSQVRQVHLTLEPWTVENGLLTTTMKLRRRRVEERFADAIRALYGEAVPAPAGRSGIGKKARA